MSFLYRQRRKFFYLLLFLFLALNFVAYNHAYQLTHFTPTAGAKKVNPYTLSFGQKVKALLLGIPNPRPENASVPQVPYEEVKLTGDKELAGWLLPVPQPRGTIILFHGYAGEKSGMLDKAAEFNKLGYTAFLVDFMGSGGSTGNQTTIGFHEAAQVNTCWQYIRQRQGGKIYLFGTSMGAVAILKALQHTAQPPTGIILECPFGSMYETVCVRFRLLHIPAFPFAGLLLFWGSVQNNFWAFAHNPSTYAQNVNCPVLLLYGAQDPKVSRAEINRIYQNLPGPKQLCIYPKAGHENYLTKYRPEWVRDVSAFLYRH